jgi:hypothetical protein
VFENRVLRMIFGSKRDEVTGGSGKLYNEELHDLYSSPSIIRFYHVEEAEVGRACNTNGEKRNACRLLVGKTEGKRPLGRPRCKWVDNIKMNLVEIECELGNEHLGSIKC